MIPPYNQIKSVYLAEFGGSTVRAAQLKLQDEFPTLQWITSPEGEPSGYVITELDDFVVGNLMELVSPNKFFAASDAKHRFRLTPYYDEQIQIKQRYVYEWLFRFQNLCPDILSDGKDAVWLISCVPGWEKPSSRDAYRQLFLDAGYANPVIVPDANGILSYFTKSTPLVEQQSSSGNDAVIINLGGEFLNAVCLTPDRETYRSWGSYIGCDMIDRLILSANLLCTHRYTEQLHNPDALTSAVWQLFRDKNSFREYLLLQCSKLKHRYFSDEALGLLTERDLTLQIPLPDHPDLKGFKQFTLYINVLMMEDILKQQPVETVLGPTHLFLLPETVQETLDGRSWTEHLESFLSCAAIHFGIETEPCDIPQPPVFLIGGGCHMSFAENTLLDLFSNCKVITAANPTAAAVEGLAEFALPLLGCITLQELFKTHFNSLEDVYTPADVFDPREESLDAYKGFVDYVALDFANRFTNIPAINLERWLDYQMDSSQILPESVKDLERYVENYLPCESQLKQALSRFFNEYVKDKLFPVFKEALSSETFRRFRNDVFVSSMDTLMETDTAKAFLARMDAKATALKDEYIAFYQRYETDFARLPNPMFKLFSSRKDDSAFFRACFETDFAQKKAELHQSLIKELGSEGSLGLFPLFHRIITDELRRQYRALALQTPAGRFILE